MVLRYYQEEALQAEYNHTNEKGIIVIPTGAGKSLIQAYLINEYKKIGRVLCLTHNQELVEQNKEEYGEDDAGFYSASICKKGFNETVVFASIQTIAKNAVKFFPAPVITIIDECHLISHDNDTMYRQTLDILLAKNPKMRVVGLTATPFRLKMGYLHEMPNAIFTKIIYEADIVRLIKEGYLSPLLTYGSNITLDDSKLEVASNGDFTTASMNNLYLGTNTQNALMNVMDKGKYRRKWLIFASSIDHCHEIIRFLALNGISCEMVTAKTPKVKRKAIVNEFKKENSTIRCLVNKDVFTTGFNVPSLDMIVLLRPTKSACLYAQMVGRGLRIAKNKDNCLILDYGFNIERHGPLNNLVIPHYRERKKIAPPPCKTCPMCFWMSLANEKNCPECGYEYPITDVDDKIAEHHSGEAIIEIPNQIIKKRVINARAESKGYDKVKIFIECEDAHYIEMLNFKAYEQYHVAMNSAILKKMLLDPKWEMYELTKYFKNDYAFVYIQNKKIIKMEAIDEPTMKFDCSDCKFNQDRICTPRKQPVVHVERLGCSMWRLKK